VPARKRGDIWWAIFQIRGQRIAQSAGRGASKAEAIALEARIRADHLAGRLGKAPRRSVAEALARWLDTEARTLKSHTSLLQKAAHIEPHCAGRMLSQILDVAESVKTAGIRAGLKPATINRRLAILRRVANLAHQQWGWLDEPLGQRIKLLPGERARHVYLTAAQAEALLAACEHPRVADAILIALTTGLRQGEILKLTPDQRRDGLILLDADTKSGRPRAVPDVDVKLPLGITYATLRTYFERARIAAGLPHVRFHDLRHTTASWLLAKGASMVMVRDLLGHSSLAVTSRYSHLQQGGIEEAGEILKSSIGGTVPFLYHSAGGNRHNEAQSDAPKKTSKRAKRQ
jgi:integrase